MTNNTIAMPQRMWLGLVLVVMSFTIGVGWGILYGVLSLVFKDTVNITDVCIALVQMITILCLAYVGLWKPGSMLMSQAMDIYVEEHKRAGRWLVDDDNS